MAEKAFEALQKVRNLQAGSGKFTHKCPCPNPEHKGGGEKTASFYFSRETGQFFCFGCQAYGDAFDLIQMLGGNSNQAMQAAMDGGPVVISDLPDVQKVIEAGSMKLIKKCRETLQAKFGTKDFVEANLWFARFYERLDGFVVEMESETPEQIGGRFLQLNMELTRKWK